MFADARANRSAGPIPVAIALSSSASTPQKFSDAPEIADLRKKYNDMVHFVVQLTSERDRLKEQCGEKTEEIEKLHALLQAQNAKQQSSTTTATSRDTLFQLLVVVLIVFFITRMVT